jgi:hypothetical protein
MKFDYYSENFGYIFSFSLTENELRNYLHKRGISYNYTFGLGLFPPNASKDYKILASTEIIRDALSSDKVDLGINYKRKYEEIVELLEPHKIDDMPPETTLKMLLKYNK